MGRMHRYTQVRVAALILGRFGVGSFVGCSQDHTPYDVVAWRGNYAPYKYDLSKFNVMGSISFDHPDPSIFTVLTCPVSLSTALSSDLF
jgi:homogentisate 1,2-dioxygenase